MATHNRKKGSDKPPQSDIIYNINFARAELLAANPKHAEAGHFAAVDIYEDKKFVYVNMEVPGIDPKHIKVTIERNVLTIQGFKPHERTEEKVTFYCAERQYGDFHRKFGISGAVDPKSISASCKDGVLRVTIPKLEDRRNPVHKIEVESDDNA